MQHPPVPLDLPQFEFAGEGVILDTDTCDHESVPEGTVDAEATALSVNGDGEDHLLPPHALYPETFSAELLLTERELSPAPEPIAVAASNPPYVGQSYGSIRERSDAIHLDLQRELVELRPDPKAYMKRVREIGDDIYRIPSNSVIPTNYKMAKGLKHGWRTEGIVLAPNTIAGLDDVCPFRSPLCTVNCLNLSGHAEIAGGFEGDVINCRRRRTLMFLHVRDAFLARVAGLIDKRASENVGKYAIRLNVMSDLSWEKIPFYNPYTGVENGTLVDLFPNVQFYDYTKNCKRYIEWLGGKFPPNYYLAFSMSEINALFAIYALTQGGSVTVIFDAMPEHTGGDAHVRYPAEPLPRSFCGFPVIDGDQTDLRFEDRDRFGIPKGQGFVVGLRLKGKKHRREYKQDKEASAGFIFDAKRAYPEDYIPELIAESEKRRLRDRHARERRDLPGMGKQKFLGIPGALVTEARRVLGL